jgi:hypothetical protein
MMPKEIFLSHSSKNKAKAEEFAEIIRRHGIPIWYSKTNIRGAQQWMLEIGNALKRCDWFVVLISKDSVNSTWVKRELAYALCHNQYEQHILPVIIEDCDPEDLSWTISIFQMIDMKVYDPGTCQELLRTWGVGYIA